MADKLNNDLINKRNIEENELNNTHIRKNAGKLAFYIGSLEKGGAERVFVNLAEYFMKQGWQVVMVTQYRKKEEYVLADGIDRVISDISPQETTENRIVNFYRRFRKLRGVWKQERPDLVLSCVGKNNFMTIATTMFTKTKPVVSVVGEAKEEYPGRLMPMLADLLFPFAAGIILQTERSRGFFSKKIAKTAVILPNSLNPLFMRPRFQGERDKRIVSVGRLDANKNHEMMIRAFAALAQKYPEHTLTVYGDGELRADLQELIVSLGLSERVFLPGVTANVADRIERAELFLLTSYSEGLSNALIEAMALGLTVIATDVPGGGTEELISHGENGWVIPVGSQKALVEAMDLLLSDQELAAGLGEQAHRIQERLAPERVNGLWQAYFETITGSNGK